MAFTRKEPKKAAAPKHTKAYKLGGLTICWLCDKSIGDNHYSTHTLVTYSEFEKLAKTIKGTGWHIIQAQEVDKIKTAGKLQEFIGSIPAGYSGMVQSGYHYGPFGKEYEYKPGYLDDAFRVYALYGSKPREYFSNFNLETMCDCSARSGSSYKNAVCLVKDYPDCDKIVQTYKYNLFSSLRFSDDLDRYADSLKAKLLKWAKENKVEIVAVDNTTDSDDDYKNTMWITTYGVYHSKIAKFLSNEKDNAPYWVDYGIMGLY